MQIFKEEITSLARPGEYLNNVLLHLISKGKLIPFQKIKKTQNYNTLEEINKGIVLNQKDFYSFQKGWNLIKSELGREKVSLELQ